jgi:hypothetical protein
MRYQDAGVRNVVVSLWSESTPLARRRCLAVLAAAAAASLIARESPAGPGNVPPAWPTFLIEGTVTEVNGLDVATGTRVTGRISFDPDAPGTFVPGSPSIPTEDPDSVVYRGVAVELTVGSQSVRGNDRAASTIQLAFLVPSYDVFRVEAPTGFRVGRVAGQAMHRFWLGLVIIPSRWPNQSIPLDPTVFDPGFAFPGNHPFCLGACAAGQSGFLIGQVTRVARED